LGDLVDGMQAVDAPFPLAAVSDKSGRVPLAMNFHRRQADLDREVVPVAVPACELQADAHHPSPRRREEAADVVQVASPEALGKLDLDRFSYELLRAITEQDGDRWAREEDLAGLVDDDDRVGTGRKKTLLLLPWVTSTASRPEWAKMR
jgi:hypothetical protein